MTSASSSADGAPAARGAAAGPGVLAGPWVNARPADAADDLVLLDGELVPRATAVVSAFDRGVLYGESLFETLKVVRSAPCLWDRHRDRLAAGCVELGIPLDLPGLEDGVRRLLEHTRIEHGVLRVQVTGGEQPGGGRGMTAPTAGRHPRVVAGAAESAPPAGDVYASGVRVVSTGGLLRPSPWLKSGNYLASVRAKALAESAGAFECILVAGEPPRILEGSFSNVLLWDGEVLVSPPEGGRLPGVTVGVALEEAARAGLSVITRPIGLGEVAGQDRGTTGLLLTGSLLGVCPCSHVDGAPLRTTVEIAGLLRERLLAREEETRRAWSEAGG
ncbi:MAG: aminotransferase class IV [Thermoleophilia bacterium]